MSKLPIGMFIPGISIIHRLDARAKLLSLIILLIAIVLTDSLIGYAIDIALIIFIVLLSRISFHTALASVKGMYGFFVLIFFMNVFFFSTEGAYFSFSIFHPSFDGVMQGFNVVFRVLLVLVLGNVLTCTTAPIEVTKALESLISPLRRLKIPTEQVAMIISAAVRFIPVLMEEADMIRKAQTARGAGFDSRKLTEKAAAVMPLVLPVFLGAFRCANELSMAMEARGYRSASVRTKMKHSSMNHRDFVALAVCMAVCLVQRFVI